MSKKFSSFAEQQLITENFRKFINENKTTKDVGGGGVDKLFIAIANSMEGLSKGGKEGFAAGLKYISENGYNPEKGDYKKIVNNLNDDPKGEYKDKTLAWKNGFKDAAYNWDDFMEDKNIESDRIPGLDDFKNFKGWLDAWEEREEQRLDDEDALDFDEYSRLEEIENTLAEAREDHIKGIVAKIKRLEKAREDVIQSMANDKNRFSALPNDEKAAGIESQSYYTAKQAEQNNLTDKITLLKNQLKQLQDAPEGKGNVGRLERD